METIVTQSTWQKSKLIVKGLIIGALALLLLIPADFVQGLVKEREARQKEAFAEVSSKWAGKQILTGPIIVLPYWQTESDTSVRRIRSKHFAYFLPDNLQVDATVTPLQKYRGIYKVMLYNSKTQVAGSFSGVSPEQAGIPSEDIIWNEAFVKFHISDSKGINDELKLKWNDTVLALLPQSREDRYSNESLSSSLNINSAAELQNIRYAIEINLNGSEQLLFTPVGKISAVNLNSKWPNPSFTGNILPQTSQVNKTGFTASWKSLTHKRNFPQQWKDNAWTIQNFFPGDKVDTNNSITGASFGVDLFIPVNGYQKIMRSVKYAILCILLTFTAFFLIETNNKRSVHPVQYALVGFALILFYTLLLSFSEYIGFNGAYAVAGFATIGLITWFVKGLLQSVKLSMLLSFVLLLLYSYIFTILQLEDYALLLGSVGLFLALAIVMYYSKKIRW